MALTRMIRTTLWVLLSVVLTWVLLSVFWAPPHLISTTPYPVDQTPATRSLDYQDITIPSDDLLLEGWWIPASQPIADLIFVHGAGSNRISQYIGSRDFYRTLYERIVRLYPLAQTGGPCGYGRIEDLRSSDITDPGNTG